MRSSVATAAFAAVVFWGPMVAGYQPALCQEFSITNQVEPADAARRDLMRQLQALWDARAYYPAHASNNDEGGTVKIHLKINPDGNIAAVRVMARSRSQAIDAAGAAAFRDGFVKPFAEGAPGADVDLSLHYVLTHRQDDPATGDHAPILTKSAFTITNDLIQSPTLGAILQRTCTGKVVRGGIRNHPWYGWSSTAEAIFFRRPDGAPWVKFYEGGYPSYSPVVEVGKVMQWTGREEHVGKGQSIWLQYSVWPDGANNLIGNIGTISSGALGGDDNAFAINLGGTADFTCATDIVPPVAYNAWLAQTMVLSPGDPP